MAENKKISSFVTEEEIDKVAGIAGFKETDEGKVNVQISGTQLKEQVLKGFEPEVSWDNISDKPETFAPITGTGADQAMPGNKFIPTDNTQIANGRNFITEAQIPNPEWNDIQNKPETFKPIIGTGAEDALAGNTTIPTNNNQITNGRGFITESEVPDPEWDSVQNKPATFPPTIGSNANEALAGNTEIPAPANDGILTINVNGSEAGTFSANASDNETINITAGSGGDGVQTLDSLTWDYNNGNSAIFTPSDNGADPIDVLIASNFPAGARGSLKVIPTNTTKFGLFDGSKIPSSQNVLTISAVNPTIFHYFYDGNNFYWFYDVNYIDAVNLPPAGGDPSVNEENLLGFYFPGSTSLADGANVPLGTGWEKSAGGSLINTLTRTGTSVASSMKYFARNEVEKIAPYWKFDGIDVAWQSNVAAGGEDIESWSASCYFKVTADTGSGYNGLFDPNTNDEEVIYLNGNKLIMYDPSVVIQGNYPAFTAANNLQDKWIFTHVDVKIINKLTGAATIYCYIGNQLTRDACTDNGGPGFIVGTDGENIILTPNGLCVFGPTAVTLSEYEGGWQTIIYGAGRNGIDGSLYEWSGDLGMVAFYNGQLNADTVQANWDSTRASYYIT